MNKYFYLFTLCCISTNCIAEERLNQINYSSKDNSFTFLGGVGYTWIKANEVVYGEESGNRISHLIWRGRAPLLTAAFTARPDNGMTVSGRLKMAFAGNNQMRDYDWIDPYFKSYDFDDWTDRSVSDDDDVDLNHYVSFDIAVGHDFALNPGTTLNLHGGFKYTAVKWTATGGTYTYSMDGFRDDTGHFPNRKIIDYEQKLPAVFLGAALQSTVENWSFTALGRVGMTVSAKDKDNHFLRDTVFIETFESKPYFEVETAAAYALTQRANIYLSASYEKYLRMTGDIMKKSQSGTEYYSDSAGADLQSFTVSTGIKVSF